MPHDGQTQGPRGFPNILGLLRATNLRLTGKTGATAGAGLAGGTTSGAPTSGSFDVGEAVIDQTGALWICTATGSPGTFVQAGFASPLTTKADVLVGGTAGAASRLGVGSDNQVLTADSSQTLGLKWAVTAANAGGALTQIAQTILGSTAATITFSSIAASYSSLLLTVVGKSNATSGAGGTTLNMQFNGDSGANYDWLRQDVSVGAFDGATAFASSSLSLGYFNNDSGQVAPTTLCIMIYDYARTAWQKGVSATGMFSYQNTAPGMRPVAVGGLWRSTAAITSVLVGPSDGSFKVGAVATLYGLS